MLNSRGSVLSDGAKRAADNTNARLSLRIRSELNSTMSNVTLMKYILLRCQGCYYLVTVYDFHISRSSTTTGLDDVASDVSGTL